MSAALFVTLNVVDAFLTKTALSVGAVEYNPVMAAIGSSLWAKGGIALALAFLLYYFRQRRALWVLNVILFGVVIWNMCTCFIMNCVPANYALFGFHFFG
jgi:glucose dehydrogenase